MSKIILVVRFLRELHFTITGQSVNVAFLKVEQPYIMILSSVAVTVGMTASGIILFRKKDLK